MTQEAYERLRADLLACRLLPGDRLKIAELCDALSVSLGAVREALSRLTSEGLVVAEPQRGFRVAPISPADLRDLTEVRAEIEGMCLTRAIALGGKEWEKTLRDAFDTLSGIPESPRDDPKRLSDRWAVAHAAFHQSLVAACDSPWLLKMRAMLYAQSERYRHLSVPLSNTARNVAKEHRDIMKAALARRSAEAVELLKAHLRLTTRIVLEANILDISRPKPARPRPVRTATRKRELARSA